MFIANDIASLPVLPQAPAPQAQQPLAQTQGNQDGSQTGQTQNTQDNTQNGQQTGNSQHAQDDNHFSKLLNARQQGDAPVHGQSHTRTASDTGASNTAQANADTTDSTQSDGSANGKTNTTVSSVVALFVSTQLQALGGNSDAQPATDTTATDQTAATTQTDPSLSLADVIQQLQQLLQQLLAQTDGSAPAPDANAAAPTDAANTDGKQATDKSGKDDTSLSQLLAQLAAMLQSLVAQAAPQQTNVQVTATQQDTGSIDANGGGSTANDPFARLAQLMQQLEQQLGSANTDGSTAGKTADATTTATASASFDSTLSAMLQQPDTKSALQTILSDITQLLAPVKGGKPDSDGSSDKGSDNSQAAATQALSAPAQTQSAPDSGFMKLLPNTAPANTPVVDQVLVQIKSVSDSAANQIKIQLSPEDLGKVTVQMNTGTDGKTGITITADNRQTLAMLQNEARSLEAALRDIGLKTDTGGLNFNLSGQQQQQHSGNTGKQGSYTPVAAIGEEDVNYQSAATQLYRYTAQDGLDIRV